MQTYLAFSEISPRFAHARLIAWRSEAALVVHLVELTLKQTQCSVVFEPRPSGALSVSLSLCLCLSVHFFLFVFFLSNLNPLPPPPPLSKSQFHL